MLFVIFVAKFFLFSVALFLYSVAVLLLAYGYGLNFVLFSKTA